MLVWFVSTTPVFKGKERPAQSDFMTANLRAVLVSAESSIKIVKNSPWVKEK